jgi:hypothetical protein
MKRRCAKSENHQMSKEIFAQFWRKVHFYEQDVWGFKERTIRLCVLVRSGTSEVDEWPNPWGKSDSQLKALSSGMQTFKNSITGCNKKTGIWAIFSCFFDSKILKKMTIRDNFMRGIDYAHSWSFKTLSWPWFREVIVYIEAKISKIWIFLLKIIVPGVILCEESEKHAPESKKCFPESG